MGMARRWGSSGSGLADAAHFGVVFDPVPCRCIVHTKDSGLREEDSKEQPPQVRSLDFSERGHSCPPFGFGVDHHAKADKNVRAPVARANDVGKI